MANVTAAQVREAGSPAWWLQRLGTELWSDRLTLETRWAYFTGDAAVPEAAAGRKDAYIRLMKRSRTNWADAIVGAVQPRLIPSGIRTGADGDENGDKVARKVWDDNDLDVGFDELVTWALTMGRAYTMVGLDEEMDSPLITAEDPRQCITWHDPAKPRRARAGLKTWVDDVTDEDVALVLLPGMVFPFRRRREKVGTGNGFDAKRWTAEEPKSLGAEFSKLVPMQRILTPGGFGEYGKHLDHLDRINTMVLQRVVVAVMQAFRQRAVKGDLPDTDKDGKKIDYDVIFASGPDALWQLPEDVDLWESAQVDLTPILTAVKDDVTHLGSVTFTPLHMLLPETVAGSAEGATLAREGLVYKTERHQRRFNVLARQMFSDAFTLLGDTERAAITDLGVIWASAERRSLSERADASSKAQDIPWRTRMQEVWGFDPPTIDRMESERAADMALQLQMTRLAAAQSAAERPAPAPAQQGQSGQPGQQRQQRPAAPAA